MIEIEYKFLLEKVPLTAKYWGRVEQCYMPQTKDTRFTITERVSRFSRGTDIYHGIAGYSRNVKIVEPQTENKPLIRYEYAQEIDADTFWMMYPMSYGKKILKDMYYINVEGSKQWWKIDDILNCKRLVIAEIEVECENDEILIPKAIESVMIKNVTHDPAYESFLLAKSCHTNCVSEKCE